MTKFVRRLDVLLIFDEREFQTNADALPEFVSRAELVRDGIESAYVLSDHCRINWLRPISMICPKCHTETPAEALQCPGCNLPTPRGNQLKRGIKHKASMSGKARRSRARDGKTRWQSRLKRPAAIILFIVVITAFGLGCYLTVFSYLDSKRVAADVALGEMNKLRRLPSRQEGLNVEEFLDQEFKKYKDRGYLLRYQGWRTKIIKGTDTNFLVIFSFEDTDNVEHRAEWLVDVRNSSYTPQTDLAIAAYKN